MSVWTVRTTESSQCWFKKRYVKQGTELGVTVETQFKACQFTVVTRDDEPPEFDFRDTEAGFYPEYGLNLDDGLGNNVIDIELLTQEGVDPQFKLDMSWDLAPIATPFFRRHGLTALDKRSGWDVSKSETWVIGPIEVTDSSGYSRTICADDDGQVVDYTASKTKGDFNPYEDAFGSTDTWWTIRMLEPGSCQINDFYPRKGEFGQLCETKVYDEAVFHLKTNDEEPPCFGDIDSIFPKDQSRGIDLMGLLPMNNIIWATPGQLNLEAGGSSLNVTLHNKAEEIETQKIFESGGLDAVLAGGLWETGEASAEIWIWGPFEITNSLGYKTVVVI